jgi:hypothetical protein
MDAKSGHNHSGKAACPACATSRTPVKIKIPEKCLVKFRPDAPWKGEYGFDWMREGDTSLSGDTDYRTIVGSYGIKYATETGAVFTASPLVKYLQLKSGFYNPFPISWKKDAKGKSYDYMVPWLSLFPKSKCQGKGNTKQYKVKLKLYIEIVSKEPDVIRLVYNPKFLKVDKKELLPKTVGKHTIDLTISCIKSFDVDQKIEVIPYKKNTKGIRQESSGKLMVLKNGKAHRYKANVVFVKVQTKINITAKVGKTANEASFLEKYFQQALTSLNLRLLWLNLKTDNVFNTKYVMQMDPFTNAVNTYLADGTNVHSYLESAFKLKHPGYGDWFKIFFFDENGGNTSNGAYQGLNGCASGIPGKSVVLYNTHNTSTTTHELLHAVGLYHTFDNSGRFTYMIGATENIMDYSHSTAYSNPVKNRISTWKWQWDILHSKLQKE